MLKFVIIFQKHFCQNQFMQIHKSCKIILLITCVRFQGIQRLGSACQSQAVQLQFIYLCCKWHALSFHTNAALLLSAVYSAASSSSSSAVTFFCLCRLPLSLALARSCSECSNSSFRCCCCWGFRSRLHARTHVYAVYMCIKLLRAPTLFRSHFPSPCPPLTQCLSLSVRHVAHCVTCS